MYCGKTGVLRAFQVGGGTARQGQESLQIAVGASSLQEFGKSGFLGAERCVSQVREGCRYVGLHQVDRVCDKDPEGMIIHVAAEFAAEFAAGFAAAAGAAVEDVVEEEVRPSPQMIAPLLYQRVHGPAAVPSRVCPLSEAIPDIGSALAESLVVDVVAETDHLILIPIPTALNEIVGTAAGGEVHAEVDGLSIASIR